MKLYIIVLCVTSSQGINYDALKKCTNTGLESMMCEGVCLNGFHWCNDLMPQYCSDSEVMTNDLELCADDERWEKISCDLTWNGQVYPGERCTDCDDGTTRNYCIYPQGIPEDLPEGFKPFMPTTCDCDSSSQSIKYDALDLVPCSVKGNDGMKCGEQCLPSYYWCNDKFRKRCPDLGVMTNDPDLCSQDERWSNITCDIDLGLGSRGQYPGERCTNCVNRTSNYCYYTQGAPVVNETKPDFLFTTCNCDTIDSPTAYSATADSVTIALVVILLVLVIIAAGAVGGGVYYYNNKKKQLQGEATQ